MRVLVAQLRRTVRGLLRSPSFTLVSVFTLAIGMASATLIFSVVDAVLLTPLPYPASDRLVGLWHTAPGLGLEELPQSDATYLLYRERARSFTDVALYRQVNVNLVGGDAPARLPAALVTPSLFQVLRARPRLGRPFQEAEGRTGAVPVVLLSDRLWRRRFGADPAILGRRLRIDGLQREVVGVLPPDFDFPQPETEFWLPLEIEPAAAKLGQFSSSGVARLRDGVTPGEAQGDIDRLLARLEQEFPGDGAAPQLARAGFAAHVKPLRDDVVGDVGSVLWLLLGAVGFVLLIACANVSNLLVVRSEARRREAAIHSALGATAGQLMRSVLVESLLLAITAAALGLLLATGSLSLLVRLRPLELPRLNEAGVDGTILLFAAFLAVLSSGLAGLLPALRSRRDDLTLELKSGGSRTTIGPAQRRTRQFLVGLQVALALVLLIGSGLMLRSFLRLSRLDPGFRTADVLTFQLAVPETEIPDAAAATRLFNDVVERLAGLPGVTAAGASSTLPLSGSAEATGHVIESSPVPEGTPPPVLWFGHTTAGYFDALGIPLLAGRTLTRADQEHRAGAVVVNRALAERFWPRGEALGRRLRPSAGAGEWYTVVGVVGNVRNRSLAGEPDEIVYYSPQGRSGDSWTVRQMHVVVRTAVPPSSLLGAIRGAVAAIDAELPVTGLQTMERLLRRSRQRTTYSVIMFALATGIALALGAVGIYGFVSYVVAQRTAEVGVRMAVGASTRDIRWLVLRESLAIALAGTLVGMLTAVVLTQWLGALLFEVSPLDPLTFALVPLLLFALVLLSSALPAERAAHLDPLEALRLG